MTMRQCAWLLQAIGLCLLFPFVSSAAEAPAGLAVQNGWFVYNGKVVWGYAQHNGWWRAGQRPNIARNAPGQLGPNRTEDLDELADAMLRYGYPGFEHNFGLWYDRRRDRHDTARREDANVVPPFLEQPWARSRQGTAWDGLPKYDLTKYNGWYFRRLKQFAEICGRKGTVLLFNFYMQHALLETNAHYVDFPWRPANCIQRTGLPDSTPAANAFYDVSHPGRRELHQAYIRKCLDELGGYANVVFLCSEEYTGPTDFMQFWLDTIIEWEQQSNKDVHIGLSGCKDVVDALLSNRQQRAKISMIDLRYWWYERDGLLFAPKGGREIPGRYIGQITRTTAPQIYRQVREYRLKYPKQAIIHGIAGTRQHSWAALMGGASMLVGQLPYPDKKDPSAYISPELCRAIQPTYDFVRKELAEDMPQLRPHDSLLDDPQDTWCLADASDAYLVYTSSGRPFRLDLSAASGRFQARWFDPLTGKLIDVDHVIGGAPTRFTPPSQDDWALWLVKPSLKDHGQFAKWSKIEIAFIGPDSRGRAEPNPFSVRLDVNFTSPKGKQYHVPGFYDGNGKGGLDGNVWKIRFSADELGPWKFETTSDNKVLDGKTGRFTVTATAPDAAGFWKWGRLESIGTAQNKIRYLKFRDGPYWLKAGCDDPENFLGNYRNYNTLAKRQAVIDYLADRGVNSFYIMTHNIGGDDRDVWPWLGKTEREAMSNGGSDARYDVAKLDEWRELFEYMQAKGVVPYLVLEDDSAWKGYDRDRYYREIIARFGYLPALLFNCGEEHNENYRLSQAIQFMRHLQEIDPYDHPRGIHNVNQPNNDYVDAEHIDFTSIQTGSPGSRTGLENALEHNSITIDWINRCLARKRRVLIVNFDEARPEEDRRCWWSVYIGGGVWETHLRQPYDRPVSTWEPAWTQLGGARAFMESVPFWEMEPHNGLVVDGRAFCLAKTGHIYALYLPTGGSVTVSLVPDVTHHVAWWNPENGKDGRFQNTKTIGGGPQRLTAPSEGDWALRIIRKAAR